MSSGYISFTHPNFKWQFITLLLISVEKKLKSKQVLIISYTRQSYIFQEQGPPYEKMDRNFDTSLLHFSNFSIKKTHVKLTTRTFY